MNVRATDRGFRLVEHRKYASAPAVDTRLIQESSAIGDYDDAMDNPGSSYLWIGDNHHLNREEIADLIGHLQYWLDNGRLHLEA